MVLPETEALVIVFAVPPEVTVNALVPAVVVERFSLYVRITLLPSVLVSAELKIGGIFSVTEVLPSEAASLPEVS